MSNEELKKAVSIANTLSGEKYETLKTRFNASITVISMVLNGKGSSRRIRSELIDYVNSVDPSIFELVKNHGKFVN